MILMTVQPIAAIRQPGVFTPPSPAAMVTAARRIFASSEFAPTHRLTVMMATPAPRTGVQTINAPILQ